VLDTQGRSRAWINGSPATLAQLEAVGEQLIDVHGQHAHQSLGRAETQRSLLDAFGGFSTLTAEVALAWRAWRTAVERHQNAARDASSRAAERDALAARHAELSDLGAPALEGTEHGAAQARLARGER
jgi:DNA repair protein RecN (Recombination protein N)